MEPLIDYIQFLETDAALYIMTFLDCPADLIRASTVSRFWRHFVIENGLFKQLCVRMFPQLANIDRVTERGSTMSKSNDVGCSNSLEWEILERDHKVHASLFQALTTYPLRDCIGGAISASSTDNYPRESVINTLPSEDMMQQRGRRRLSYWSSKGHRDPQVPERLIYKLKDDICALTEINIQPFQAYFQSGHPIYSAKFVRFRLGHPKCPSDFDSRYMKLPTEQCASDKFIWTYTSQEFPMAQENQLQKFKLPELAVCMGGFLQIELLGRVQRQEMDDQFYICVAHVQAVGRLLHPSFSLEVVQPGNRFLLKYDSEASKRTDNFCIELPSAGSGVPLLSQPEVMIWAQQWEGLVEFLMHGNQGVEWYDSDDDDDEVENNE